MKWTKKAALARMRENQGLQQIYERHPLAQLLVESAAKLRRYPNYNRVSCHYAYKDWMWAATGHVDSSDGWTCIKVIDDLLPPDACDLELEGVPSICSCNPLLPGLPSLPESENTDIVTEDGKEIFKWYTVDDLDELCNIEKERHMRMYEILKSVADTQKAS